MKTHLDCFPCFLKQSLIALRYGTRDKGLQEQIVKDILIYVEQADTASPPAYTTTLIHRRIRELLGGDPFRGIKSEYNGVALRLYPSLKRLAAESTDPFGISARLAIAGNVIDFGIFTSVDIEGAIERALHHPLTVDDTAAMRKALEGSAEVLYLLDNAGEIVFDRILIETLQEAGWKVTAVVKGAPVLNDCTIVDAREAGLTEVCEVIDNGSDAVGTILPMTSQAFRQRFQDTPLVISKGQGNFETVAAPDKTVFYLFQSKCEVVSRELGVSLGSMILSRSKLGLEPED